MKSLLQISKDKTKLIPYTEVIIGIILLSLEVYDYFTLYSMEEVDAMYGDIVDFYKYKENTFCPAFLWTMLILTGISYWTNKKLYWISTQALILLLLLKAILPFYAIFIELNPIVFYIFPLCYFTLFIAIEIQLFKINQIESIDISTKTKLSGLGVGILCCIIYILLL